MQPDRRWRARARDRWPELVAALVGVGWFLLVGGWRALPVTSIDWPVRDQLQHVVGWMFFRRSPWGLPLGRIDGLAWPVGTTVGYTDANPLLAIPFKLVSGWLPNEFQYVGPWLAACFALQGWVGARIAARASDRPGWRILAGTLFVLSPVLLARREHDTLSAHWGVLALILLHLQPAVDRAAARALLVRANAVALLLTLVHPYLGTMALVLTVALLARVVLDGLMEGRDAIRRGVLLVLGQAALYFALGYFTSAPSHAGGFGLFATDLLAWLNPWGASSLLPAFRWPAELWEGNAYLGAGGILLLGAALVLVPGARARLGTSTARRWGPLAVAATAMLVYAVSPIVHAGGGEVLALRGIASALSGIFGAFHSSGRFVWPFYYLAITVALFVLARRFATRPRIATAVLAVVVVVQVVDLAPPALGAYFERRPRARHSPTWALARGAYDLLALYPPQVVGVWSSCRGLLYGDDDYWTDFAFLAYDEAMAINSAQLARGSGDRFTAECDAFTRDVEAGRFRPRTVYVVHPSKLDLFRRAGAVCGAIDGHQVCVSPVQHDRFRSALASR